MNCELWMGNGEFLTAVPSRVSLWNFGVGNGRNIASIVLNRHFPEKP